MKLFDSELKIMDVLWRKGKTPAKEIADELGQSIGWNKNTTYTVIKKCVDKGNGIKLGLKQALEMHKLKVVQECEW